jgi:Tol biopolymer transport system component
MATAVVLGALAALTLGAGNVRAAYPGTNDRIAFVVSKVALAPGQHPAYTEQVWSQIETVLPNGHGQRRFRVCPAEGCFDGAPAWSPDGKLLAFATGTALSPESQLAVIRQDGQRLRLVPNTSLFEPEPGLSWAPDGHRVLFVGAHPFGVPQLFTVALSGSGRRQITNFGCGADEPSWSVKGTIAFAGGCAKPYTPLQGIYTKMTGGSQSRRIRYNPYWAPAYPDWSPSGRQLAYAGSANYNDADVFLCNPDGSAVHRLTFSGGTQPAWSPDGKYIAFIRHSDLYVVRQDGQGLRRVVSVPARSPTATEWYVISSPSWQPRSPLMKRPSP